MRELKVRAFSNYHNRYCDFVTLDEIGRWIGYIKTCGVYLTTADLVLEQYTGLKDKNDKEIYEGDIVRVFTQSWRDELNGDKYVDTTIIFQVKWDEEETGFSPFCDHRFIERGDSFEVIGNIHENKELLDD